MYACVYVCTFFYIWRQLHRTTKSPLIAELTITRKTQTLLVFCSTNSNRSKCCSFAHVVGKTVVTRVTTCVTWLIHMCDMTHSYVWHDSFICVTWLIHVCYMTHLVRETVVTRVTWLNHLCDMTHSYEWHDSFICVTWLIHMCDMTHLYVWHDLFKCVTWLIRLVRL